MGIVMVVTTVGGREDAREMARAVVGRNLAACAQISEIESFYKWKGEVQNEGEFRVLFKTTAARRADVENAIREMHPYELPAIIAVAVDDVFEPFAEWVREHS